MSEPKQYDGGPAFPCELPTPITDAADRVIPSETTYEHNVRRSVAMADLERQLAEAMAQLRIADEQLALERAAIIEARAEIERLNDLLEKIVCRYAEQEEQP